MNPLFGGNGAGGFQVNPQLAQMVRMMRGGATPQALMGQFPQLQQVMNMCKGQNPRDVFYSMCNQRGVNPDDILNQLR